jgi:hypothetical protein
MESGITYLYKNDFFHVSVNLTDIFDVHMESQLKRVMIRYHISELSSGLIVRDADHTQVVCLCMADFCPGQCYVYNPRYSTDAAALVLFIVLCDAGFF